MTADPVLVARQESLIAGFIDLWMTLSDSGKTVSRLLETFSKKPENRKTALCEGSSVDRDSGMGCEMNLWMEHSPVKERKDGSTFEQVYNKFSGWLPCLSF